MARYSPASEERLSSCHPDLQRIFKRVLLTIDHVILEGHRGQAAQHAAFLAGKSKLDFPKGKHNSLPSMAVDAAPFPVNWQDRERLTLFAGFVLGTAQEMGIKLRWGGDWAMDWRPGDNVFDDLVHYEIAGRLDDELTPALGVNRPSTSVA